MWGDKLRTTQPPDKPAKGSGWLASGQARLCSKVTPSPGIIVVFRYKASLHYIFALYTLNLPLLFILLLLVTWYTGFCSSLGFARASRPPAFLLPNWHFGALWCSNRAKPRDEQKAQGRASHVSRYLKIYYQTVNILNIPSPGSVLRNLDRAQNTKVLRIYYIQLGNHVKRITVLVSEGAGNWNYYGI